MMPEKILALLAAFFIGAGMVVLLCIKLISLGIRHSPRARQMLRVVLDRADATHALRGSSVHPLAQQFELGIRVAEHDARGLCEIVIDPPNKPHIDENGSEIWRSCPNPGTFRLANGLRICAHHYRFTVPVSLDPPPGRKGPA